MTIDIIFIILVLVAVFKGLRRGLIVAIFSMLALVIGLAAALKLSAVTALYLNDTIHVSAKWLPVLAFLLVFVVVVLLVRWTAALIEKATTFAMLGWINKLAGVLLYAALYITIFSVLLFYGANAHFISADTIAGSRTYAFVKPWGPALINGLGSFIPFFRDMFAQLEAFFDHISRQIQK
jgi:membrane protein required for colicin V production